jgi:hypothetical protein
LGPGEQGPAPPDPVVAPALDEALEALDEALEAVEDAVVAAVDDALLVAPPCPPAPPCAPPCPLVPLTPPVPPPPTSLDDVVDDVDVGKGLGLGVASCPHPASKKALEGTISHQRDPRAIVRLYPDRVVSP